MFLNLLANAAQAIRGPGAITIETGLENGSARVTIADTGPGIPADLLGRVFDPFFTTKPVGEGTGLGLSISYEIVKRHGGEIAATSPPGGGAVFTVRLPLARVELTMPAEINCLFTKGLLPYVEREVGPEGVARLLQVAGRSRDYLMAEYNWIPFSVAERDGPALPGDDGRAGRGALGPALRRRLHGLEALAGGARLGGRLHDEPREPPGGLRMGDPDRLR